jgi:dephospho-CoA kinase
MLVIGITGPTGAGKTTALRELEGLGGCILDADALYHQMLESNLTLRGELEARFGNMTDETGKFQRKKLGSIVFADPQAMGDLNAITKRHLDQGIRDWLDRTRRAGYPAAAIDAIRLFESGANQFCDVTLAITAPPEVRVRRIVARENISEDYAWARVNAQQKDAFYTERCDYILVNDCETAAEFGVRAKTLLETLLK